jgi:hypothetical protein
MRDKRRRDEGKKRKESIDEEGMGEEREKKTRS